MVVIRFLFALLLGFVICAGTTLWRCTPMRAIW
jgi:hypothetical protein